MKTVDYDAHRARRTTLEALICVNELVIAAKQETFSRLPTARRKKFFVTLRARRAAVFASAGIAVPRGVNVLSNDSRRAFIFTLPIAERVKLHQAMSAVVREIALAQGLTEIAELEEQRSIQLGGVMACRTDADVTTIAQLTRDTVDNVKAKHRSQRASAAARDR